MPIQKKNYSSVYALIPDWYGRTRDPQKAFIFLRMPKVIQIIVTELIICAKI